MGPLQGIRVIELAAIGPTPFCCLLLAQMGAEVIRVDRLGERDDGLPDPLRRLTARGRRSLAVDLKQRQGAEVVLRLVDGADVLVEGFRPGVAERLGIGPEPCSERNRSLVYGRMTGWGRQGPMMQMAGHDINYIALVGALHAVGREADRPVPPLNLIGDYAGGALYLAMGILAALIERNRSGSGQVVDAAMVDGSASLMTLFYELLGAGFWEDQRGANLLDGGAPFYDTYETSDGKHVAVGALEPRFFAALLDGLGIDQEEDLQQMDLEQWPQLRGRLAGVFRSRTRDQWEDVFAGTDACVTPVLSLEEAPFHPHNAARGVFAKPEGSPLPEPAPRFSRTPGAQREQAPLVGADTFTVLAEVGFSSDEVEALQAAGVVSSP